MLLFISLSSLLLRFAPGSIDSRCATGFRAVQYVIEKSGSQKSVILVQRTVVYSILPRKQCSTVFY